MSTLFQFPANFAPAFWVLLSSKNCSQKNTIKVTDLMNTFNKDCSCFHHDVLYVFFLFAPRNKYLSCRSMPIQNNVTKLKIEGCTDRQMIRWQGSDLFLSACLWGWYIRWADWKCLLFIHYGWQTFLQLKSKRSWKQLAYIKMFTQFSFFNSQLFFSFCFFTLQIIHAYSPMIRKRPSESLH